MMLTKRKLKSDLSVLAIWQFLLGKIKFYREKAQGTTRRASETKTEFGRKEKGKLRQPEIPSSRITSRPLPILPTGYKKFNGKLASGTCASRGRGG